MRIATLPCHTVLSEPAGAVLLHASVRPRVVRLVVVTEAYEHLVGHDLVQDLVAGPTEVLPRMGGRGRSSDRPDPRRRSDRASDGSPNLEPAARRDASGT